MRPGWEAFFPFTLRYHNPEEMKIQLPLLVFAAVQKTPYAGPGLVWEKGNAAQIDMCRGWIMGVRQEPLQSCLNEAQDLKSSVIFHRGVSHFLIFKPSFCLKFQKIKINMAARSPHHDHR
jgi:hypothetical protein